MARAQDDVTLKKKAREPLGDRQYEEKRKIILISIIAFIFSIFAVSCKDVFNDDLGTFYINFGSSAGRSAVLTQQIKDELTFTIRVTDGPGKDIVRENLSSFNEAQKFTVTPGNWTITVEAYLDGVLFASGSKQATINSGQNGVIEIEMQLADGDFVVKINLDDLENITITPNGFTVYKDANDPEKLSFCKVEINEDDEAGGWDPIN